MQIIRCGWSRTINDFVIVVDYFISYIFENNLTSNLLHFTRKPSETARLLREQKQSIHRQTMIVVLHLLINEIMS